MSVRKIVVIGPESTGKSTLSQQLASALGTVYNPEYARAYLDEIGRPYEEADLLHIAKGQLEAEDRLADMASNYLICDTDLNVIKVWSESKYGRCNPHILEWIAQRRYDLYLLTYPDFPWLPDPQREHPDPADRLYFYNQYRDIVSESGTPWIDIRGTEEQRLTAALKAINEQGC